MANKIFKIYKKTNVEFFLDGKKIELTKKLFSPIEKIKVAFKIGVVFKIIEFFVRCKLKLSVSKELSGVSGKIYETIILSFLKPAKEHIFILNDPDNKMKMEAKFSEKDSFLSVFRILDNYAKDILINQYNLPNDLSGKLVIDGGANLGEFAILCGKRGAKVYAFEPLRGTCEILKRQIEINGLTDRVFPIQMALGDKNEKLNISYTDSGDPGATLVLSNGENTELIEVVKLDDFLKEKIDLLKLDVEGYEENVLNGAKNIIKKDRPVLALSAYHKPTDMVRLPELIRSIDPNYKINYLTQGEPIFYCEV